MNLKKRRIGYSVFGILCLCLFVAMGLFLAISNFDNQLAMQNANVAYSASPVYLIKNWKSKLSGGISYYNSITFTSDKSKVDEFQTRTSASGYQVYDAQKIGATDATGATVDDTADLTLYSAMKYSDSSREAIVYSASEIYAPVDSSSLFNSFALNKSSSTSKLILENFNTSNVENMSNMFSYVNCQNVDFSKCKFITTKVTNMSGMFRSSYIKTLDFTTFANFNTANVTDMSYMFYGTSLSTAGLGNTYSLNFGNNFSTAKVENMSYMFGGYSHQYYSSNDRVPSFTTINLNFTNFNTASVKNMSYMFANATSLTNLVFGANFKTTNVTAMNSMFLCCYSLKALDLTYFNTSQVTNMSYMFAHTAFKTAGTGTSFDLNFGSNFDVSKVTNFGHMFGHDNYYSCEYGYSSYTSYLTSIDLSKWKCAKSEQDGMSVSFANMFCNAVNLTSVNFGDNFTTYNVTSMYRMFYYCTTLSDVVFGDSFIPSKVTNFSYMFAQCTSLVGVDLSTFQTLSATDMSYMFYNCYSMASLDLRSFITSKVTNFSYMFAIGDDHTSRLSNLTLSFDTLSANTMKYMFANCNGLSSLELSSFNTTNVTDMSYMFYNCSNLNSAGTNNASRTYALNFGDNFYTNKVTDMQYMFYNCTSLSVIDLSKFNTPLITNIQYMFYNCTNAQSIKFSSKFTTENVTQMRYLFTNCSSLNGILDLRYFDASMTESAEYMFSNCKLLKFVYLGQNFTLEKISNFTHLFANCQSLQNVDLSMINTQNATDMSYMFYYCASFTSLNLQNFDTSSVTSMWNMFAGCSSLDSAGVSDANNLYALNFGSNFNTSAVTDMASMFEYCSGLTTFKLPSNFSTAIVTNMSSMFANCSSISDFSAIKAFDTTAVKNMNNMFSNCYGIVTLDLSGFSIESGTNINNLLDACSNLETLKAPGIKGVQTASLPTVFKIGTTKYMEISSKTNAKTLTRAGIFLYSSFRASIGSDICQRIVSIYFTSNLTQLEITKTDYNTPEKLALGAEDRIYSVGTGNTTGTLYSATSPLKAYLLPSEYVDEDDRMLFNCVIYAPDNLTIYAPQNCSYLFAGRDDQATYFVNLKTISLDNLDTTNAVNMSGMFSNCEQLNSVKMNKCVTTSVAYMDDMFGGCDNLSYIYTCATPTDVVVALPGLYYNKSKPSDQTAYNSFGGSTIMELARIFAIHLDISGISNFSSAGWTVDTTKNVASKAYYYNDTIGTLPTLSNGNRVFTGWGTYDGDDFELFTQKKFTFLSDVKLSQSWAKAKLVFDFYYGSADMSKVATVSTVDVDETLEDGTIQTVTKTQISTSTAPADWQAKFVNSELYVYIGDEYGVFPLAVRRGFDFLGWYTQQDGGDLVLSSDLVPQFETYEPGVANQINLYAQYDRQINPADKRTITFDANGGRFDVNYSIEVTIQTVEQAVEGDDSGATETVYKVVVNDVRADTPWVLDENGNVILDTWVNDPYGLMPKVRLAGCDFLGWYTSKEGGDCVSSTDLVGDNCTLYARFKIRVIEPIDSGVVTAILIGVAIVAVVGVVAYISIKTKRATKIVTINESYINDFNAKQSNASTSQASEDNAKDAQNADKKKLKDIKKGKNKK